MGPGYDIHFDCAADESYSDALWLMERREPPQGTALTMAAKKRLNSRQCIGHLVKRTLNR